MLKTNIAYLLFFVLLIKPTMKSRADEYHKETISLYSKLKLSELGLSVQAFECAMEGWMNIKNQQMTKNNNIISIIDFTQSSKAKRLYIIDVHDSILLYQSLVAHGRNSGEEFAHTFSNDENSYESSLGFYITEKTYSGKHGISLRLRGIEENINSEAIERGIVMHGANYVGESFIKENGRLGRSQGCTAIPSENCSSLINCIKDGTCLFIYYPDTQYLNGSHYLNPNRK
jgi:hypothetical protein